MPLGPRDAAHLLRRAGFGALPADVARLAPMATRTAAVDSLLAGSPTTAAPTIIEADRDELIRRWWLNSMRSGNQVTEKLAFFWHGHFCSSLAEVEKGHMIQQVQLFRAQGMGDFRGFARNVALQPAMLNYLDNELNAIRKTSTGAIVGVPQENFGRELLELFLLGVTDANGQPQYTEADVQACARAWTGHNTRAPDIFLDGIEALDGLTRYQFYPERHDDTPKTFLGITRNWDGPEIIDHLCTDARWRTVVARHIARKLFGFYAYPDPTEAVIAPITAAFAATLNVKDLVRAILVSDAFWSESARTGLVRQPVDYTVAALRVLDLNPHDCAAELGMPGTGQELLAPPNVSGWRPNAYWLSTSALQARADMATDLLRFRVHGENQPPFLPHVTNSAATDPVTAVRLAFEAFGIVDEPYPAARRQAEAWVRDEVAKQTSSKLLIAGLATLVMLSPDYQMA